MGKLYCLAGALFREGRWHIAWPLPAKSRDGPVRNVGWSPWLLDGHSRWEIFELLGPQPAAPEPPHLEDLWVRALKPLGRLAPVEQRRQILAATLAGSGEPLFGVNLSPSRLAAYLRPGTGLRSLATVVATSEQIVFQVSQRDGVAEPDVRITLRVPGLDGRLLPVKDHHLLSRAEQAAPDLAGQVQVLNRTVRQMGPQVAVRLGLSRPFQLRPDCQAGFCWLMADGFFSLADPQP